VLVLRAGAGTGPGRPAGPDPYVVLVVLPALRQGAAPSAPGPPPGPPTIDAHRCAKSGMVFDTQETSLSRTPGTASPSTAPARAMVSSLTSDRSASSPWMRPVPRTVSPAASRVHRPPIAWSSGRSWSPGWVVAAGQPGTVTAPPVTSAAARNGAAPDRSGSIS